MGAPEAAGRPSCAVAPAVPPDAAPRATPALGGAPPTTCGAARGERPAHEGLGIKGQRGLECCHTNAPTKQIVREGWFPPWPPGRHAYPQA